MKFFWFAIKAFFSAHAKPTDKEKSFFSAAKFQLSIAPKLTRSYKFHPRKLTVSLLQNNSFSKLRSLAFAVRLPFRTDSNPHRRYPERLLYPAQPVTWWTLVTSAKAMYRAEIWIVPGVQRFANLWGTFGSFRTSEKNKTVPFTGNFEVLQTSIQLAAMAASHKQN